MHTVPAGAEPVPSAGKRLGGCISPHGSAAVLMSLAELLCALLPATAGPQGGVPERFKEIKGVMQVRRRPRMHHIPLCINLALVAIM